MRKIIKYRVFKEGGWYMKKMCWDCKNVMEEKRLC